MYLIMRKDKLFVHIGLYLDENTVLHYASKTNNMFAKDQSIRLSTLNDFTLGRKISIYLLNNKIDIKTIHYRADSFSRNGKCYNILFNNCLSFLISCLTGKPSVSVLEMLSYAFRYRIFLLSIFIWD